MVKDLSTHGGGDDDDDGYEPGTEGQRCFG